LMVAEKPSLAGSIAQFLSSGQVRVCICVSGGRGGGGRKWLGNVMPAANG
jgi:hypothetical protein